MKKFNSNASKIKVKVAIMGLLFVAQLSFISCSNENIVARVGDKEITKLELEDELARIPERRREKQKNKALDRLIKIRVFSNEAKKAGLENDAQVKADLEKSKDEILARLFVKLRIDEMAKPTSEDIKKYYEANTDQFIVPDGVLIQHLLYKTKDRVNKAFERLKEGVSFEKLAKRGSLCNCWKKEGRHAWLYKGQMDPVLEKAAFSLEIGKISDVIKTKDGYQIIKVLERKDSKQFSFEESKEKIRDRFFQDKKRELIHKSLTEARINNNPSEKGVLLKIGNKIISEDVIASVLAKIPAGERKERQELKRRWRKYLSEKIVFSSEARKVNLDKDLGVQNELNKDRDKILSEAFLNKFISKRINVGNDVIEEYYQSHFEEFRKPVKYRAKHIVVKSEKEAQNIKQMLKKGESFNELVLKRSIHPSAKKGCGEMGWFGKREKEAVIEEAVFALKEGEISDVVETDDGFQIFKLIKKIGGDLRPLISVKSELEMRLKSEAFKKIKEEYYNKAGVEIFLKNIDMKKLKLISQIIE